MIQQLHNDDAAIGTINYADKNIWFVEAIQLSKRHKKPRCILRHNGAKW